MSAASIAGAIELASFVVVALSTGTVALVVLLASPRRGWNWWLAFFLALVAGNFATEAIRRVLEADPSLPWAPSILPRVESLGFLFLTVDAAALVYFVSIFPRRSGPGLRTLPAVSLGALVAVFLAIEVTTGALSDTDSFRWFRLPFFAYVHGCYLYACWRILTSALLEPSEIMATQVRIVTLGILVAMVPRISLVGVDLGRLGLPEVIVRDMVLVEAGARVLILWGLLALTRALIRRRPAVSSERRKDLMRMMRPIAWVALVLTVVWLPERAMAWAVGTHVQSPLGYALGNLTTYGARWLVFCVAMILGIVRYQLLAGSRRALLAPASLSLGVLAVFAVGLAARQGTWAAAVTAGALTAGGAAALGILSRGPPQAGFIHDKQLEVYRSLLASAIAEGPLDAPRRARIEEFRLQLDVSMDEHDALLAIAQAEEQRTGPAGSTREGRYEILRRLGSGGYATVHLARDAESGQLVVLKRISGGGVGEAAALDAALREVEVARRVSHPNLVAIHSMERVPDGALLVMEYAGGGSLADRLVRGPLATDELTRIASDVLSGLSALHEAGLVHGDVKPENILLRANGRALLADLGLARATRGRTIAQATRAGAPGGTLAYMAPEVIRGAAPTEQSDVYAVAACLRRAVAAPPGLPREGATRPQVVAAGGALSAVIARGLAERPEDRFASAAQMRAAIAGIG